MPIKYCLGFIFNRSRTRVLLIRKARPTWQAGLLNGIGGKVEPGETFLQAMIRETREECWLEIACWSHFATMSGVDYEVQCFVAFSDELESAQALTDEALEVHGIDFNRFAQQGIPGIAELISKALQHAGMSAGKSAEPDRL